MTDRRGSEATSTRPLPVLDDTNRHYWEGARNEQLTLLRCDHCRRWAHPSPVVCRGCQGRSFSPAVASGRGHVYSWSVMHSPGNPGFEDRIPYVVLVVELEEQPGLLVIGNLFDAGADDLRIGLPLEVCWERIDDDVTLPQWRPADDREESP